MNINNYKKRKSQDKFRSTIITGLAIIGIVLAGGSIYVASQEKKIVLDDKASSSSQSTSTSDNMIYDTTNKDQSTDKDTTVEQKDDADNDPVVDTADDSADDTKEPTTVAPSPLPESSSVAASTDPYYNPEQPILVNLTNLIPDNYILDLVDLTDGYQLDRDAAAAYNAMIAKAKSDGISLWLVSAYRSTERQINNFNNKVKEYESMGYTAEEAYAATAGYIAVPGTSEHSIALAVDINSLEESFENTEAFKWLYANCADFGFIMRYPKDKTEITNINYEPWHYRYVGSNHAKIIMENEICLEEYLSGDY